MWYICIKGFYLAVKKKAVVKFVDKWVKTGKKIIVGKISQVMKDKCLAPKL